MAKKLKALAGGGSSQIDLAKAIRESAQSIWLAGLGAFSKAQAEGNKVFDTLVKQGRSLESVTRKLATDKVSEVTSNVGKAANRATATWDKLEQVFEDRVARALQRLGVPTNRDIQALSKRVEQLTESVQKLSHAAPAAKKPSVKRAAPGRRAAAKSK
ncbi:MAG: phasin family protein [Burkholderiales bacterium]|nr:phasin family protein [Burkholderiales bacterium]